MNATIDLREGTLKTDDDDDAVVRWMLAQQRSTGAFCMNGMLSNGCSIEPYIANRALIGLLYGNISVAARGAISRETILSAVSRWVDWYLSHVNEPDVLGVRGTVYDYTVAAGGVEKATLLLDTPSALLSIPERPGCGGSLRV